PNSTFVNLTLVPNEDGETETRIQYAVAQLGAWKISYRLRSLEEKWEMEGQAVVDNSTDEPWNNVIISVLSGSPLSFATELAEIRSVRRNRVNVVADQALNAVTLADSELESLEVMRGLPVASYGLAQAEMAVAAGSTARVRSPSGSTPFADYGRPA